MQSIRIEGGSALSGFVYIQGSKNAALPVMAAALLHQGITTLYNCPKITDVLCMEAILKELGAVTAWDGNTLMLDCTNIDKTYVPSEYANRMRSSIVLMGSMLGRTGCIKISYPGGCTIGKRPIDLHLKLLQEMGARIEENEGILHAVCAKIHPVDMTFPNPASGLRKMQFWRQCWQMVSACSETVHVSLRSCISAIFKCHGCGHSGRRDRYADCVRRETAA